MQAIQVEYTNPKVDANLEMKMPDDIFAIMKKNRVTTATLMKLIFLGIQTLHRFLGWCLNT